MIEAIRESSIIFNLSNYISSSKIHLKPQYICVRPTITPKRAVATIPMQQTSCLLGWPHNDSCYIGD